MDLSLPIVALRRNAVAALRPIVHSTYDAFDRLSGSSAQRVPPRRVNPNLGFTPQRKAYEREFESSGEKIADMLAAYGLLDSSSAVLDIGSGIGRVARALASRLGPDGRYCGFDADPKAIAWCQAAYRDLPNFTFDHAPLAYMNVPRTSGQGTPEDYRFPYDQSTFDLTFSISVFTHLSSAAVDRYLAETRRVLRPQGLAVNTFFVLDDFAIAAMKSGTADRSYVESSPGVYVEDLNDANKGIAFTLDAVHALHEENGLEIVEPVHCGTWSGREGDAFIYQDVVVARLREESQARPPV